jgi:pyridoxamine 5'-phosphate oxidase
MTLRDPLEMFRSVFERASAACVEADAMALATVDTDGRPSVRYVLLKSFDECGFVFYTNLHSRKARALATNPNAALCSYWPAIGMQVRVEGRVETVGDAEADAYFQTRPRASQIGAWASDQSAVLPSRAALEQRVADLTRRFEGSAVPRPSCWSGFRVVPCAIEFWTRDVARLHERERFDRDGGIWRRSLLYP